jgi:hypothetical protein
VDGRAISGDNEYGTLPARAIVAYDDEKTAVILVERVQDGPKGRSKSQPWS